MINILLAGVLLILVAACNAQTNGGSAAEPSHVGRERALPVIAVSASEIKINGKPVWLGETMSEWKRVLGGVPNCYDAGGTLTCVWHSNGLSLGTDHADKTRVKYMKLHVAIEPPALGERAASWPQAPFHGTLELDGIPIHANTAFRDLRRDVAPTRELRCGGSDCGNPSAAFSNGANIYMSLAGRSENASILRFSISCSSTEACVALIPSQVKR